MSNEDDTTGAAEEETTSGSSGGEGQARRKSMGEGIKEGLGVLSAFRDALEETIQEARERGDLSADRAKVVMKETLEKAQTAAEGAREKLDFATQADLETVKGAVDAMKERLGALEESVFGASKEPAESAQTGEAPSADTPDEGGSEGAAG